MGLRPTLENEDPSGSSPPRKRASTRLDSRFRGNDVTFEPPQVRGRKMPPLAGALRVKL